MAYLAMFYAIAIVTGFLFRNFLPQAPLAFAQTICISLAPPSNLQDLYQAIVCGAEVRSVNARQAFISNGLIHILVVSGSHLIFLDQLFSGLPIKKLWKFIIIQVPFTFLAGLQAPVVRALVQRGMVLKLPRLSPLQLQGACSLLVLGLVPQWLTSVSFLLSWMCALLLALPRLTQWPLGLEAATKMFVGLLPFAGVIGLASPLSVLTNWLLGPLVGLLLFPASLLCFFIHGLAPVVDLLWMASISGLSALPLNPPTRLTLVPRPLLFCIPLLFQISLLILEVQWQRKKLFSV